MWNCELLRHKCNKCCVFRLPNDNVEKQKWINVLPPHEDFIQTKRFTEKI